MITIQQQDSVLSHNFEPNDVLKYSLDQQGNEIGQYQEEPQSAVEGFFNMEMFEAARDAIVNQQGCRLKGFFEVN